MTVRLPKCFRLVYYKKYFYKMVVPKEKTLDTTFYVNFKYRNR